MEKNLHVKRCCQVLHISVASESFFLVMMDSVFTKTTNMVAFAAAFASLPIKSRLGFLSSEHVHLNELITLSHLLYTFIGDKDEV